jgi:hypothetical protein
LKAKEQRQKMPSIADDKNAFGIFWLLFLLVEPFAEGYYKIGDKVKAQQLLNGE